MLLCAMKIKYNMQEKEDIQTKIQVTLPTESCRVEKLYFLEDVSTYDVSTYDVSTYDVSTYDVSTYDVSTYDVSTYDVSTYDVSTYDVYPYDFSYRFLW
jgi:hypothetical protein